MTKRMAEAVEVVAAGIRVLARDGIPLSEDRIIERARNIVAGLMGCEWFSEVACEPPQQFLAEGIPSWSNHGEPHMRLSLTRGKSALPEYMRTMLDSQSTQVVRLEELLMERCAGKRVRVTVEQET